MPIILIPHISRHPQSVRVFPALGKSRYDVATSHYICWINEAECGFVIYGHKFKSIKSGGIPGGDLLHGLIPANP